MKKPIPPCKGCTPETGRSVDPNCHATCEKYLNYKSDKKVYDSIVQANKSKERLYIENDL